MEETSPVCYRENSCAISRFIRVLIVK